MSHPLARRPLRRGLTLGAAAVLTTALTPLAAFAQDATWNGPGNNFNSNANWTPAIVPTNRATFLTAAPNAVNVTLATTLNQLRFGAGASPYTITNQSTLTINGIGGVGIDNQSGAVQVVTNNGTMTLNNASVLGGTGLNLSNIATGATANLIFNGATQLDLHVSLLTRGSDILSSTGTVNGANARTEFHNNSSADGATLSTIGGSGTAIGSGAVEARANGGDAVTAFTESAHADNAHFNVLGSLGTDSTTTVRDATATGGLSALVFANSSHADGALFDLMGGGTVATSAAAGPVTSTAVGSVVLTTFLNDSHADNATFNLVSGGVTVVAGPGAPGAPLSTGSSGGSATGIGSLVNLTFTNNAHADGATINNLVASVSVSGGSGGSAGATGSGGTGGVAQGQGSNINLRIDTNAHVDNGTITSTAGSIGGAGGLGANGGATVGGGGGAASGQGGNVIILLANNASVNGTDFTNTGGNAQAFGGNGGAGGAAGTGGFGGESQVTGGNVTMILAGNVTLAGGTRITNTGGDAQATGGRGGNGGTGAGGGTGGAATATGGAATVTFQNNASAGNATIVNTAGAVTATSGTGGNGNVGAGGAGGAASAVQGLALVQFADSATAGSATIENHAGPAPVIVSGANGTPGGGGGAGGSRGLGSVSVFGPEIRFSNNATGGSAHILNDGGLVTFNDNAIFGTAAGGGARIDNSNSAGVDFQGSSSLGNGQVINGGGTDFSLVSFGGASSAGTGSIINNNQGYVEFVGNSSMGSATITNNSGALLDFTGSSDGVAGTVINATGATVNVFTDAFRLGSLSGAGTVNINSTSLQVGYLDRNETFSGVIAGSGALLKRGTGTWTLTGSNTFTGGAFVRAGTLQIGNGGTTGSVAGNIDLFAGANVTFNRSDAVTYGGVVSGGGSLTKAGAGTLILTGTNTYTGGTTINSGVLQIGNGGTTGSITGDVTNNANITFNRSDNLGFSGVISGSGSLTKTGLGVLVLTGANTYTGGTTVNAGSLQIGNAGTTGSIVGNVSVSGGAALVFNRTDAITFGGNISGAGQLTKLSVGTLTLTGNVTLTGNTLVSQGALQIGNGGTTGSITGNIINNGTVFFNRSDTITYGGVISGTGTLTQLGTGTLVLTGNNTHGGGTFVLAGTLELNGNLASITQVSAAGRLTGTGTIGGNLVANGTIAPGNAASPFGTLTVTANASFNNGSVLAPTVNSAGQSSLLQAGALGINGGQVRPTAVAGGLFLMQTDFRIANGTIGRTGTFTGVDESLLPSFLDASLNYVGNDVFLRLRRNATAFATATGLTANQAAVGSSLDAAVAANNALVFTTYLGTYNALLPLSGTQLQGALNVLSGDALTAFPVVAQEHANRFGERLNAYTWSNSSNLWGLIAYGDQDADGDGNGPGFQANGVEFQMGFNTSLGPDTRLGLSVGFNNGDVALDDRLTSGNVDTWSLGAQLRHDFGPLYVSGQLTYSWHSIDSSRPLLLPGTAEADYDANTWTAAGEIGWVIRSGSLSIEPHVSVRHASTSTDAYSETGPAGVLDVAAADYDTTRFGIGLRLANRDPAAPVRFHAMVRYERETGDEQAALDNALPGLPTFRVVGTRLGDDILSGEVGAEVRLSSGLSLFAAGGGHTRSNETSLQANAGLRVVF